MLEILYYAKGIKQLNQRFTLFYIAFHLLCHLTFNRHAKLQYYMQFSCSTLCNNLHIFEIKR